MFDAKETAEEEIPNPVVLLLSSVKSQRERDGHVVLHWTIIFFNFISCPETLNVPLGVGEDEEEFTSSIHRRGCGEQINANEIGI